MAHYVRRSADDFDAQTVLEAAYNVGRYGTLEERLAAIDDAAQNGVSFTTGFSYDRAAIDKLVDIIADSLEYDATDATLTAFDVQTRTFTFSDCKARLSRESDGASGGNPRRAG